eukprot:4825605-Pyramimonas_sp.AAC.1
MPMRVPELSRTSPGCAVVCFVQPTTVSRLGADGGFTELTTPVGFLPQPHAMHELSEANRINK